MVIKCYVILIWLCCFVCSDNPRLLILFTMKDVSVYIWGATFFGLYDSCDEHKATLISDS